MTKKKQPSQYILQINFSFSPLLLLSELYIISLKYQAGVNISVLVVL